MRERDLLAIGLAVGTCASTHGSVTTYTDQSAWNTAAGSHSTITFTELPQFTWITDQYAYLGVHFTDGADQIKVGTEFVTDNFGLNGAFDSSSLEFDTPMTSLAILFPGDAQFKLYSSGQLIYTSGAFGGGGPNHFAGIVSTQSFDKAIILDPFGGFFADNLYFGPQVPAPATIALLGLGAVMHTRTRRRTA